MPSFKFSGKVIAGEKVGRTIGFPTANLDQKPTPDILKPGAYAGFCSIHQLDGTISQPHKCLAYFGPRYIFDQEQNSFEIYIYDFNQDIYDLNLEVELLNFIRPPQKITGLAKLKTQLEQDKDQGLKSLAS